MSVSGVANFNLDLTEIVEEAFERAGSELRTGYDLRTARRSLNLLFADWANRGINMWTFEQGTINLVPGQNTYPLPNDTVDLLEHVIRTGANSAATQADLTITRISVSTYATIPNKLQQARPIQIWIQRLNGQTSSVGTTLSTTISATDTTVVLASATGLASTGFILIGTETIGYGYISGNTLYNCSRGQGTTTAAAHTAGAAVYQQNLPAVTVWPTPDNSTTYQLIYWRMRRIDDAGGGVNTMDVPFRFLPCLVAGLAYYLALKVPNGGQRMDLLKQQYDEAWEYASTEDRESAAQRFVPRQMFIG
ncbi:hypothetical protein UFOVP654_18 [uncultured Caudovirales phage]|uniref:Uncharacterized protein n=1 Tax=uncultured Caudovirales phage TaxID=2100421 RepID=A0A6J5NAZ8_9CAUD|nr:hypothetical protein UFOVP654_18 [uncultured Caudovirales phage]